MSRPVLYPGSRVTVYMKNRALRVLTAGRIVRASVIDGERGYLVDHLYDGLPNTNWFSASKVILNNTVEPEAIRLERWRRYEMRVWGSE